MAKKHLSTDEVNRLNDSLKPGETRHWPEYDLTIAKPSKPLEEYKLIDEDAFEERRNTSKIVPAPDRNDAIGDSDRPRRAKMIISPKFKKY